MSGSDVLVSFIVDGDNKKGFLEYKHRILYSLFRAVSRIGMRLRVPLAQMTELMEMAYFSEARARKGLGLQAISDLFGKSLRTVSTIHHRYRVDFFAPEHEVQFRREIAQRLSTGSSTMDQLTAAFPDHTQIELVAAIEDLLLENRIIQRGDVLHRNPEEHNFFSESDINARIDGLNRHMDVVAETVWARFLSQSPPGTAMARSFLYAGKPEEVQAMLKDLLAVIRDRAIALDESAQQAGVTDQQGLSIVAAPLEEEP